MKHKKRAIHRYTLAVIVLTLLLAVVGCSDDQSAPDESAPDTTDAAGTSSTVVSGTTDSSSTTEPGETTTTSTSTTVPPLDPPTSETVQGINTISEFSGYTADGLSRWQDAVPAIQDIRLTSTADGAEQPALWLPPQGDDAKPLVLILHSWSAPYLQHAGIPYAMWAQENGWAVIAPQFRGVNDDADAVGSDLAVQDVVDAIEYATSQAGVDGSRVYAVGYSGGGMMSLLLAGRHPDKVAAVAAWGPPVDLVEFYRESGGSHYSGDISAACGGNPTEAGAVQDECIERSPLTHLDTVNEHDIPVLIGQGIHDSILSTWHGVTAFNALADESDRLNEDEFEALAGGSVPDGAADPAEIETFFGEGDPAPVFARRSDDVLLVLFDDNHEMVYQASMRWFASHLN